VLFDQDTPVSLRNYLIEHQVSTAYELGWGCLENGDLLTRAESHGFEVLVTTDKNLRYQQNLASRQIAVVVLMTPSWPRIERNFPQVIAAINGVYVSSYIEVDVSDSSSPPPSP